MAYQHHHDPRDPSNSSDAQESNLPSRTVSLQQTNSQGPQRNNHYENGNGAMAGQGQQPGLTARYHPGGNDGYQIPIEVVSPLPQRRMPEVPANMQENLANLELGANRVGQIERSVSSASSIQTLAPIQPVSYQRLGQQAPARGGYSASYEHTNAGQYQNINNRNSGQQVGYDGSQSAPRSPRKSSIFPKPRNAGPNVPMSDDEKEAVLERARSKVMTSNDPDMQLAWAQDSLQWVEISVRDRENDIQANTSVPMVEEQIRQDAMEIVKFLSDQGHPKAEFMKGAWMEFGKFNYPIDKKEAFLCYRRAANREVHGSLASGRAEYRMGWLFESTKEMSKAIPHYQLGVDLGDAASSYRLGMMTLLGEHGQFKDARRGVELIRFAADFADENAPQGAYMYGMLLAREIPSLSLPDNVIPIDIPVAKYYIEKAAYLGFAKAQLKMGQAYELCQLGCDFDPALSLHYNALAARQGEPESDMAISKWFLCGHEGLFEKNEEQAFIYASRAAQTEMPTAEFAMGYFYEIGIFVPSDMAIAKTWYEKAASHGNQDATSSLERLSSKRYMSRADHQTVGLTKIKSMHGSQRRPDPNRVRRKPTPMGGLPEGPESVSSSRQSVASGTNSSNRMSPASSQSSRPPSIQPYPVEDTRQQVRDQALVSPQYGSNVVPSRSPDGRLSTGSQSDRPLSASGARPLQHSSTAPNNANNLGPVPQRSSTASGNMPMPQNGRGQPPMGQGYAQRQPSPSQSLIPPPKVGPQYSNGGNQRPQQIYSTGQAGYPNDTAYNPNPRPNHPTSQPLAQQQQYSVRSAGLPNGAGETNIRPPRGSSIQPQVRNVSTPLPQTQQQRPMGPQAPQVSMNNRMNAPPTASAPAPPAAASAPAPAPAVAHPPVKTGPKTFEEMGVHVQKKDSECVVM